MGVKLGRRRRRFRLGLSNRPDSERESGELARKLEEFYDYQDTEMLVRLAGIRRGLWT